MIPPPEQIREQLGRILESASFRASEQRRRLLSFLVYRVLEGRQEELKEYAIGVEALGRPASFDPRLDSIVRVQATHVRTRLRDYYNGPGRNDPILIDLPIGGYVPTFAYSINANELASQLCEEESASAAGSCPVVAVLPCLNLNPDRDQQYFCDGVTEEIINELAQWPDLRVIARTSAFCVDTQVLSPKEIGKTLGAEVVLESSCRSVGDRIRITARLTNTDTGFTFWSDNFDKQLSDMIAFQEEIAATIVTALRIKISEHRVHRHSLGENPELYSEYLLARYHLAKRTDTSLAQAIEVFQSIIARDPSFALAHAGLADGFAELGVWGMQPVAAAMQNAWKAAHEAIRLNENLAEAHLASGTVSALYHWDCPAAKASFLRAIRLAPSDPAARCRYGLFCLSPARSYDEGLQHLRLAVRLDPLSLVTNNVLALGLYYAGLFDEALSQSFTALKLSPEFTRARSVQAAIFLQQGAYADAAEAIRQDAASLPDHGSPLTRNLALSVTLEALQGNHDRASALLNDFVDRKPSNASTFWLAIANVGLGNLDKAFSCLEEALHTRDPWFVTLAAEPLARPLRHDPRFTKFVSRVHASSARVPIGTN